MEFEKVIRGIVKYLDREIYAGMNDWQEILARLAVSRMIGDEAKLKQTLLGNSFVRTFAIMDGDGNVDVDGLVCDLKKQIEQKGKISLSVPLIGDFKFTAEDVDKLYTTILGA